LPVADKVLERTLFPADAQNYRYSQGSVLKLDGDRELLMAVSVFGEKGGDGSAADIRVWPSHDGGLTWASAESYILQSNIGQGNTKNPPFLRLSPRSVLFYFNVGNSRSDEGPWYRSSEDNARTWSEPIKLPYEGYGGLGGHQALLLKSSRILAPCFLRRDAGNKTYSYTFYSDDQGRTWQKSNEITVKSTDKEVKAQFAAEEPSVVELDDGRLLMFLRTYTGFFLKAYLKTVARPGASQ
jgi:hypothetical protein